MPENWEDDENKTRQLSIPGMALPGLRDLRIQFVAVIEFDTFLGPVVHLKELSRGSSYIEKLKDYQTVSEVYAGLGRSPVDTQTTKNDLIAVFRHDPDGNTDITTLLLISCIPETDLEPIREIGQKAIFRARGDPSKVGKQLSIALREYQSGDQLISVEKKETKIQIIAKNRIQKPLQLEIINGFFIYDYSSEMADMRFFPEYIEGTELNENRVLQFIDNQKSSIEPNSITSFLFKGIPFVSIKSSKSNFYLVLALSESNFDEMNSIRDWLVVLVEILPEEWKFCSDDELNNTITVIDHALHTSTPEEYIRKFLNLSIKSKRIKLVKGNQLAMFIEPPRYIEDNTWELLDSFEGNSSIHDIQKETDYNLLQFLRFLEWANTRGLIDLIDS